MATQTQLAEHLDLTQGALSNLIRQGVLPPAKDHDYDLDKYRSLYLAHLRGVIAGRRGRGVT